MPSPPLALLAASAHSSAPLPLPRPVTSDPFSVSRPAPRRLHRARRAPAPASFGRASEHLRRSRRAVYDEPDIRTPPRPEPPSHDSPNLGPLAFAACCLGLARDRPGARGAAGPLPGLPRGKVAFCYLGDIWTAGEDGKDVVRLTANKARDVYPRFSPDGKTDRLLQRPRRRRPRRLPDPRRRGRGQPADHAPGRRPGPGLDARRQVRPLRQPARRGLHGQALHRPRRRRARPRRRPRHGRRRQLLARRHQARRQPQGPGLLAEVLPGGVPERRHRDGPGGPDVQGPDRLRRHGLLAAVGPRRLHLLRLRPRPAGPGQPLARPRERRRRRARDRVHRRRRPLPGHLGRRQDDRLRARLRHQPARPRHQKGHPASASTSPPRPRRA